MRGLLLVVALAILANISFCRDEDWACDPLEPNYCMLPFPNDFWRGEDGTLDLHNTTFPQDKNGKGIDPDAGGWNALEGFLFFLVHSQNG